MCGRVCYVCYLMRLANVCSLGKCNLFADRKSRGMFVFGRMICLLACLFVCTFVCFSLLDVCFWLYTATITLPSIHSLHSLPQLGQSNLNAICVFGNPTDCCTLRDHVDGHLTWNVVRIKTMEFIKRTNYPSEWREWVTYAWLQTKSHVKWQQQQQLSSDGSMDH